MAFLRGKYGPYEGFDVGDLARKRYVDVAVRRAGLWPSDRALDVATGHGTLANAVARHFTRCRVTAIEENVEELTRAVENARVEDIARRVSFVEGAPTDLPFKDESFLVTTCALGLAFEKDHLDVLAEMHRVTMFAGKVIVVDVDFSKAEKRPRNAKKSTLGADTQSAMREMGFGKIQVQRVDTLRGGAVVQLLSAKRFDAEGEEPDDDEE